MESLVNEMFFLGVVYLGGIMLPGPSLYLILRNLLLHGKTSAIYSVFGIVCGIGLQTFLVLFLLSFLTEYFLLYLKIFSSFFLCYLGSKTILHAFKKIPRRYDISKNRSFRNGNFIYLTEGLMVEVCNPIALGFFISILSNFISLQKTTFTKCTYLIEILILGGLWFGSIVFIASTSKISSFIKNHSMKVEIIVGIILTLFGSSFLIF